MSRLSAGVWRGRRKVIAGSVLAAVLLTLSVTADVVVTRQAESRIARALGCATGNDSLSPEVSLGRTPVLLQLLTGDLDQVKVSGLVLDALPVGELDVTLHGVEPGKPPSVESMEVSATAGWDSVTERMGEAFAGAGLGERDGKMALTLQRQMMGRPVQVLLGLSSDGGSLVATPETIVLGDRRIQASLLAGMIGEGEANPLEARTVDLDLPDGASISSVAVTPEGLAVDLAVTPGALGGGSGCLG